MSITIGVRAPARLLFHKDLELAGDHVEGSSANLSFSQHSRGRKEDGKECGHEHVTPVYYIWEYMSHVRNLVWYERNCTCLMEGREASGKKHRIDDHTRPDSGWGQEIRENPTTSPS